MSCRALRRCRGFMRLCWAAFLLAGSVHRPGMAEDAVTGASPPPRHINRIGIIEDQLDDVLSTGRFDVPRPAGGWRMMDRAEFDRLLKHAAPPQQQPVTTMIEWAEYAAVFTGDALASGTLKLSVRHLGDAPAVLSLEPMRVAVADWRWRDSEAIAGLAPDGRSVLFVPPGGGELTGRWSLAGRMLPRTVEFDLRLPPAGASTVKLTVPDGYVVSAAGNQVGRVESAEPSGAPPGWQTWAITVGSRTQSTIHISRTQELLPPSRPLVLCDTAWRHIIREEDLQHEAEFQLDVIGEPVQRLQFLIPDGLQVLSAGYVGGQSLAWRTVAPQETGQSRIVVDLPEPMSGLSRPIRVRAFGAVRLGRKWRLPTITLLNSVFTSARSNPLTVRIERPLLLHDFETTECRQAAFTTTDAAETLEFYRLTADSQVTVTVDFPPAAPSVRVVTQILAEKELWRSTTEMAWTTRAGSTFDVACLLPADWEVTDVNSARRGVPSDVADWSVEKVDKQRQRLKVEFLEALTPSASKTIHVVASRRPVRSDRSIPLPLLNPEDVYDARFLVGVIHEEGDPPKPASASTFDAVDPQKLPRDFLASPLAGTLAARSEPPALFAGEDAANGGALEFESAGADLDCQATVVVQLTGGVQSETIFIECRPTGEPITELLVRLTDSASPFDWEWDRNPPIQLQAVELQDVDEPYPAGIDDGNNHVWRLILPGPQTERFRVVGRRKHAAKDGDVPLAFVMGARKFRGFVELITDAKTAVETQSEGMKAEERPPAWNRHSQDRPSGQRRWNYRKVSDRLTLRLAGREPAQFADRLGRLELLTFAAPQPGGDLVHQGRFHVTASHHGGGFRFRLPRPAQLIKVVANDAIQPVSADGDVYHIALNVMENTDLVEVDYRTPADSGLIHAAHTIPVPQAVSHSIVKLDWHLAAPRGLGTESTGSSLWFRSVDRRITWRTRLFGPLARPGGAEVFHPLRVRSWRSLAANLQGDSHPAEESAALQSTDFPPAGWIVRHAGADHAPETLTLETHHLPRIQLAAWVVLFGGFLGGVWLRSRRFPRLTAVTAVWLSGSLMAAWQVPVVYAVIAGGAFLGGGLAAIVPLSIVMRGKRQTAPRGRLVGSTISVHRPLTAGCCLAAIGYGIVGAAQNSQPPLPAAGADSAGRRAPATVPVADFRAVMPLTIEGKPSTKNPYVYLTPQLFDALRDAPRKTADLVETVILSAEYALAAPDRISVDVNAKYRVAVVSDVDVARLPLPLENAHLVGPDACRIDGDARPVFQSQHPPGIRVELPRPAVAEFPDAAIAEQPASQQPSARIRYHEVELRLRAAIVPNGAETAWSFRIPPVAASRATFQLPATATQFAVNGIPREIPSPAASRQITVDIGAADRLETKWSSESRMPRDPAKADVAFVTIVEAHPSRLEYHCRAAYRLSSGTADFVRWQLPPGTVVRRAAINGQSARFFTSHAPAMPAELLIEFPKTETGQFTVEVHATRGLRTVRRLIDIAPVEPVHPTSDERLVVTKTPKPLLAITVPADFELELVESDRSPRPIGMALDDSFRIWLTALRLAEPKLLFESADLRPLQVRLSTAEPQRRVTLEQEGLFRRNSLAWSFQAEVETTTPGVFHHRLDIDPRLRIDDVSVLEDQAERLVRWSRKENQLVLFLSRKTTGAQTVVLNASMPISPAAELELPRIRVEQAELLSSNVELNRSSDMLVTMMDDESTERMGNANRISPRGTDAIELIAALDAAEGMPRIRIDSRAESLDVDTVTTVDRHSEERWHVTASLRFTGNDPLPPRIPVWIPAEFSDQYTVEPDSAVVHAERQPDGRVLITLAVPPPAISFVVTVGGTLRMPSPGGISTLPQVVPMSAEPDDEAGTHVLLVAAGVAAPSTDSARFVQRLPTTRIPSWVAAVVGDVGDTTRWRAFRSSQPQWSLTPISADRMKTTRVRLLEHRLWMDGDIVYGTSSIAVTGEAGPTLALHWPDGCVFRGAALDGRAISVSSPAEGRLVIPANEMRLAQVITVFWSRPKPSSAAGAVFPSRSISLPVPESLPIDRSLAVVVTPHPTRSLLGGGAVMVDSYDFALERLEAMLQHASVEAGASSAVQLRQELHEVVSEMQPYFSGRGSRRSPATEQQQRRLEVLTAQLEAQHQGQPAVVEPRPPGEGTHVLPLLHLLTQENAVFGVMSAEPLATAMTISVVPHWVAAGVLNTLGMLVLVPVLWFVAGWRIWDLALSYEPFVWTLLGMLWWTCLAASALGFALLLYGMGTALRGRFSGPGVSVTSHSAAGASHS